MKFIAITFAATAAAAATSNSTSTTTSNGAFTTDCVTSYDNCRSTGDPNEAFCAAQNDNCIGGCYATYNDCREGVDPNFSSCVATYAECLGENPLSSDGTLTVLPLSASSTVAAASTATPAILASNGTATGAAVFTTEVVTSFTTYCPAATTLSVGGKAYTVSSATMLTITDCPCTLTKASTMPVATGNSTMVSSTMASGNATATTVTPLAYTGGATHFGAGSGLVAALAGAVILL